MMTYDLSAELAAHSDDVKCVLPISDDIILSASRDRTVGIWQRSEEDTRQFDLQRILAGHEGYVNSLEYIPSDSSCPIDLIASAGNAGLILLHPLSASLNPSSEPMQVLSGHHANICNLSYSSKKRKLISASWDCAARVWSRENGKEDTKGKGKSKAGDWECEAVLAGHSAAVWGVAIIEDGPNEGCYLTGAADSLIKAWDSDGLLMRTFERMPDIVRSLVVLPSGLQYAAALNDGTIRMLNSKGKITQTLNGHTDYVYHLSLIQSTSNLLSCGEDYTVRLWNTSSGNDKEYRNLQTLLHPCQTVWCASWLPNGDIVSAGSDNVIRIWTKEKDRKADLRDRERYEIEVKDITDKAAKVKSGGGGDGLVEGNDEGEMVLDIDVEDDTPPLQLKFTKASDPHHLATSFGAKHSLSENYIKQIEEFLNLQIGPKEGDVVLELVEQQDKKEEDSLQ